MLYNKSDVIISIILAVLMPPKLKLMCLHGFGTNKEFMQMQTKSLAAQLEGLVELVYIDAPFVTPKELVPDPLILKYFKGPFRTWINWQLGNLRTHEEAMLALEQIRVAIESASDHYDGALCFSQGSMIFQMIYMYHRLGFIKWRSFQQLKFFMNFSSVRGKIWLKDVNFQRFDMPSLHVLSEEDPFFEIMMVTATRFKDPQIILHSFGHKFPAFGLKEKKKVIAFIKKHGYGEKGSRSILRQSRL